MKKREEEIINKAIEVLKKRVDPSRVYLFGSRAKGGGRQGSDFDLGVEGVSPTLEEEGKVNQKIEEILGLYRMDIVYLDDAEEEFRNIVKRSGKVIYERGI